ncbi:CUB and sushi domain-containing protein 1-like [Mizuhopecten yessoensis]|uniref:CUB and sushi domain-containing protein 1-like n=1 Tax=Mizuhopecten yessoensis TaxID=6573 RepID=UPI000B45C53B|nr:CUB and sushi domain-containing protein 1-like [Mizuhopecten yessoensis]
MFYTMTWFTILVVLQVLFATSFVDSELVLECPAGYVQKDSYCYRKVYATFSWEKAEDACERDGSRLVWIDDWNENDYVHNLLDMGQEMYWTGLRKTESDWKWTGNSEVYDLRLGFWEPSQPDESNSGPECVAGMVDGNWKRVPCMKKLPFICKTPAYPPGSFKCSKGLKAISEKWKCDGYRDCDDKSDEVDCGTAPYCNWYSTNMPGSKSIGYQGRKTCLYTLKANIGERISLTISSNSAIELKADSLIIYSGGLTLSESYRIGTVEGSLSVGQRFISGNHFLIIRMTTDSTVERQPISMVWTNVVPEITNSPRELTGTSNYGTLPSPFFGSTLPPDLAMEWVITAQTPGQIITLMFDNVYLENRSSMEIYDGDMTNAVLSGIQSIPDPAMYISYSKAVKIKLSTYTAIQPPSSGFVIRYKEGCDITINPANSGTIMTPGFKAGKYPRNVACSWELTAPTMKKLTLRTRSFNLYENVDYMKVYNATSSSSTSFTGEISSPMRLLSDVGYFKIEFTSDNVRSGAGFELKYSIDCEPWTTSQETNIAYSEMPYTSFESSISVTCMNGYSFMQEEYNSMDVVPMVCEEGGKWNVSRNPDCRITYCPIPPKISNGWIQEASGTVVYGGNVTYVCEDGFVLSSSATIKCKADGTWDNAPSCTSTSCGVLPTVVNGNIRNLTATQNQYGDVIEYYCEEGYETVGPSFAYCQTNGTWSHSVPTCKALTCPLVPVMNAFWTREDGVPFDTTGMLNCSNGYKWNVTNSPVISVTCRANGTFSNIEDCVDIDECKDVPSKCSAFEDCDNTIGGFMCYCKDGYFRNSSTSLCQDILECSVNKGGCSNTCNEESPGYSCSCPSGYDLFTESNQNNISLPRSESGLRQGDIFYFNHTCVRKTCDALYHPSNGQRLTENAYTFYYEDEVSFVCNIGYKLVGNKNVTCEASGQWSASPPTCTREFCTVAAHTTRMFNSSIAPGGMAYLTDAVVFQCQYGNQVLERKMYCGYMGNGQYDWQGDDYSCPEINCGEPKVVPAGVYTSKTGNSWKDTFVFGCDNGFTRSGNSTDNSITVTCQENGRWGFGSLTCTGALCTDPGTAYDAVQVATSYEVGQTVTWTCERNGYTPDPPTVLLCQIVGSIVNWNSTVRPTCKDTQNPTFSSCPTETIYVHRSNPVVYNAPTAQDNTNRLKSIKVQPENMESGSIINENTTITYTAEDYTGNTGTCEIDVVVIEDVPSLSCPNNTIYYINTTNGYAINPLDLVSSQPWTSLTADPPSLSINFNSLNVLQKVRVTASYETLTSSCSFLIATEASTCFTASVPAIAFSGKSCIGTVQCTIDCKSVQGVQYFHSDTGLKEKQYNCTGANNWSPAISDTTCVSKYQKEPSIPKHNCQ